jgi:hypothetical protein
MALDEARDRGVIGPLLRRDHTKRDVLLTRPFDHPRGPHPARVRVKQQADHHRRVIGRPTAPITPISAIERLEIHLLDGLDHKPREMPFRQPLAHIRRHQKRLLAITSDEALSHHGIVLNPPDVTRLTRQPRVAPALLLVSLLCQEI